MKSTVVKILIYFGIGILFVVCMAVAATILNGFFYALWGM